MTAFTNSLRPTVLLLALVALAACASDGYDPDNESEATERAAIERDSRNAVAAFKAKDPSIDRFFNDCAGYVVFPNVGKGGFIVGGAHGNGTVFVNNAVDGYAVLSQVTVGLQAGGQEFSEIIFFKDAAAVSNFKRDEFELSAQASAVIAESGAGTKADYSNGIAVFVLPKGGAMLEASVGGQKLEYRNR
jgi:lipid-binding SYLF domain-containing protein